MKKFGLFFIGILMVTVLIISFQSCTKDFESPVSHNVTYVLTNNSTEPMEFNISYTDPAFANIVNLNYDTLRTWEVTIEAQNSYPCFFTVSSKEVGADFTLTILQEDAEKLTVTAAQPSEQGKTSAELSYFVER